MKKEKIETIHEFWKIDKFIRNKKLENEKRKNSRVLKFTKSSKKKKFNEKNWQIHDFWKIDEFTLKKWFLDLFENSFFTNLWIFF